MNKITTAIASAMLIASLASCSHKAAEQPKIIDLPRAEAPAVVEALDKMMAQAAADSLEIHSVMVVKGGDVVAQGWYNGASADEPHVLNSVSKTFTSLGVGLAIADSLVKLDDTLVSIFPDKAPADASDNLKAITVRDLLTMTCGHAVDHTGDIRRAASEDPELDWVKQFMTYPVDYAPGEVYCYNSAGTTMLAAIVQKVTGKKLVEYLDERLFGPLNIATPQWEETTDGINCGGWGLYLTTEDLAKTGQLLLQGGEWNGEQVVPSDWVSQMSSRQHMSVPAGINETQLDVDKAGPDWVQGYGYQMWMCRHNAFRADGAAGQFIVVMPELDAVVTMTARLGDMQAELQLVWDYLLPVLAD